MLTPNLDIARKRTKNKILIRNDLYKVTNAQKEIGKNKKYFIKTYGCQMNEHDSENMSAILESMSFTKTDVMEDADLIILNTCAIRENAHNKVFGLLGRIKHLKQTKEILVGFGGCMAQEEVIANEILEKYKWLDFVFGTHNIVNLPNIIEKTYNTKKQNMEVYSCEGEVIENIPVKRDSKYKAWVNIMYGCDKFCTYCIVPYTRGRQRSRLKEDIIKEVLELKEQGYKEVTLLGQNVNAYGKDLNLSYGMAALLESVAKTNIERIRFVTSHPWDFNDDMLEVISKYENIMPYIHLPLQSGSNKVLKLMGRRYTKEEYLNLVDKIKEKIPNVCLTTDIIVGFPNETDEDFKDTLDVVNYCKYDSAFTFIFSPRIGTPAAKMEDNVSIETKEARLQTLNKLINEYSNMNNKKYLGKTVPVLIEGFSSKNNDMLMGYTDTMKLVNVNGSYEYIGKIVDVKITSTKTWSLNGEICKK
ncbi:MAG: tRNA (N6-isopentenyl adenosine(37)-C2)-methylthiotransferase MiaB [Acholeplasma sp.]|jgi:tRNA-2-methylthio-N6-dimethylallyladenosine synthase|nr:tRNA (N6-isopentenyl adenosine(37)-C2)-methylthiotransferase MiaB [Acholeplasma sp.]